MKDGICQQQRVRERKEGEGAILGHTREGGRKEAGEIVLFPGRSVVPASTLLHRP